MHNISPYIFDNLLHLDIRHNMKKYICLYFHFIMTLKCPYYAFSKITFHAVCHVAVCEQKLSAKLWSDSAR